MSFLKRLFGGGGGATEQAAAPAAEIEYNGFTIRATPYKADGQFQTCGVVAKEIGGETKEHRFIRADRFPSLDAAAEHALFKGKQIVDQQGERVFD